MASSNEGGAFFAGLVIGGLVGAALSLLLAPQSGEETRAQIRDKSLEYKDYAEEGILEARQRTQEQVATMQAKSQAAYDAGRQGAADAYERGVQGAIDAYERGVKSAMETYEKGKQAVARGEGDDAPVSTDDGAIDSTPQGGEAAA